MHGLLTGRWRGKSDALPIFGYGSLDFLLEADRLSIRKGCQADRLALIPAAFVVNFEADSDEAGEPMDDDFGLFDGDGIGRFRILGSLLFAFCHDDFLHWVGGWETVTSASKTAALRISKPKS
ncbi:hypothetical protein LCGC14_1164160 [marine sediment metagenome]|uniref:Uncharacterized protein n=1 Tax=marine sediment metagenome TaxID=412755 RepID=A0A0F9PXC0_9ZZZZ